MDFDKHASNDGQGYPPPSQYGQHYGPPQGDPRFHPPAGVGYPPVGFGQPGYGQPYGAQPPSAIGWVVTAFILFWPMGIASLVAQLKIGPAWMAGDVQGAHRHAQSAKTRGIIGLCLGLVFAVIWIIVFAVSLHDVASHCSGSGYGGSNTYGC